MVNDDTLISKLKSLRQNPLINLQPVYHPTFHTKLLGNTSSSIQDHTTLPKDALDTLQVHKMSYNTLRNNNDSHHNRSLQTLPVGKSFNKDLNSLNTRTLQKYQDVTVKLLSDQDFIVSDEYLNDDSYLDFKSSYNISVSCVVPPIRQIMKSKYKQQSQSHIKAKKKESDTKISVKDYQDPVPVEDTQPVENKMIS